MTKLYTAKLHTSILMVALTSLVFVFTEVNADPLPNTKPLTLDGDITDKLVADADKFVLRQVENSIEKRSRYWNRDASSRDAYEASVKKNRERLSYILGVRDDRVAFEDLDVISGTSGEFAFAETRYAKIYRVKWPSIRAQSGEGFLIIPNEPNGTTVVAIADADQTPEMLCGLTEGISPESQIAMRLAEQGATVVVPVILGRTQKKHDGRGLLSSREFIYRSAYELGRHVIGYELQKVLAAVDWASSRSDDGTIGVVGYGEGGLLAFYAGAIDTRIDSTWVSGYFDSRQNIWQEPAARNVWALLEQFGDAEIASLYAGRSLAIDASKGPEFEVTGSGGAAPARIVSPQWDVVQSEYARALELVGSEDLTATWSLSQGKEDQNFSHSLSAYLHSLGDDELSLIKGTPPVKLHGDLDDPVARENRIELEMDQHTQWLLTETPFIRKEFTKNLDTSSVEKYKESTEWYREYFRNEVVGKWDLDAKPLNPRTRLVEENAKWTRYEVVLDVYDDVIAYGLITIPTGIKDGEQRPVVVCQHGLEGRPQDTIGEQNEQYYSRFATRLAERGFITFSPQNLYIFRDRFRTIQRKSYVLKKTIFSTIVPQHQQIVNWLKTLPQVDDKRIAFYGLSYGGKSAMRIPPLVTDYCLSICSADFNEWVRKNASTQHGFSYVWHGEYEIFEWDLGGTFNYAEMGYLICPRPFMVERGHFDGVGVDEWVAYEYAKVRHMYAALLKIPGQTEIEWFDGPHKINAVKTFDFLHKHLDWPVSQ